jgi:serine/threonine protein kinase
MTALRLPSEFATSRSARAFPGLQAGSGSAGAETQDPVESPQTLVHDRRSPGREGWDPPGADSLVLGRYRLLERLGAGGFGVVWRARDELLHREVAVKRVPLAPGRDSERPSREALAAARLAHPAIVALYEACAVQDAFYLISELVRGDTLARLIARRTLSDEQVLAIGLALTGALAHAHSRGVIHRDVKPQNVLVPRQPGLSSSASRESAGVAKLTDFGGARLTGEDVLTRTGDVLGTLAYMAPEQTDGGAVSGATDLYSLALVLYEALCGVNPVRGSTPAATVRLIGQQIAPLERKRPELERSLTRALDRALSASPEDRGTIDRLRLALQRALELRPGAAEHTPVGRMPTEHTPEHTPEHASLERTLVERTPGDRCAGRTHAQPPLPYELPAWQPDPARRTARRGRAHGPYLPVPRDRATRVSDASAGMDPRAQEARGSQEASSAHAGGVIARRPALPRAVSLACGAAVIVWEAWSGRPGVAMLMLAAVLPLLAVPRPARRAWPLAALAPVLGLAGLAGAYPAVAGQAARWRNRAALGALGYWWLILAEPLLSRQLWLGEPQGTPARAVWEGSLSSAAVHVVGPTLALGVLLGAVLWALAAALLPLVVRGHSAALDVLAATIWSAVIVAAAPALDSGTLLGGAHASGRGAILGAVFGALLAVAARALRGPV